MCHSPPSFPCPSRQFGNFLTLLFVAHDYHPESKDAWPAVLSQTVIAISLLSISTSPHLSLVLPIAHLPTWLCPLEPLSYCQCGPLCSAHHALLFLPCGFILVYGSTSSSCFLRYHLWLLPLPYPPLHISHQFLLILILKSLSNLKSS